MSGHSALSCNIMHFSSGDKRLPWSAVLHCVLAGRLWHMRQPTPATKQTNFVTVASHQPRTTMTTPAESRASVSCCVSCDFSLQSLCCDMQLINQTQKIGWSTHSPVTCQYDLQTQWHSVLEGIESHPMKRNRIVNSIVALLQAAHCPQRSLAGTGLT